jgi:hypothetical protein
VEATSVTLFVDPVCPFAWITSQWLAEVETCRPVRAQLRLMSLSVVNEHRDLEPWYREFNDRAWGSARVGSVVERDHGPAAFRAFYEAFGRLRHQGGDRDHTRVVATALAEAGLPADLLRFTGPAAGAVAANDVLTAEIAEVDARLRRTHDEVRSLVGEDLGTPVVVLDGAVFFGPVSTGIARGEEAARLFDAVRLLAACRGFTELKRGRTGELSFA